MEKPLHLRDKTSLGQVTTLPRDLVSPLGNDWSLGLLTESGFMILSLKLSDSEIYRGTNFNLIRNNFFHAHRKILQLVIILLLLLLS
jgi:hypothetical protein